MTSPYYQYPGLIPAPGLVSPYAGAMRQPMQPMVPVSGPGQAEATLRAQRAAVTQKLSGLKDRMQLTPLMGTIAFQTNNDGLIERGARKKVFVDVEGQFQASGIEQHPANSTFGGAQLGDEHWVLTGLGLFVRRDGTRELTRQERAEFCWKSSVKLKRASAETPLGPVALFPAGDDAIIDFEKLRRFEEPIDLPERKHLSMEIKAEEPIQLAEKGLIVVHVVFVGTRSVDPIDRAGV